MVIHTISKGYKVIKTLSDDHDMEAYLCREEQKVSRERYLVMGLMGRFFSKKVIPYFMELSARGNTEDFLDCFTWKGGLWLVFRYYEHTPLSQRMREEFLLEERLEAGRSMVERMVTSNLPPYVQYEGLNPDNVVVSRTSEVYFNFLLKEPEFMGSCRMTDVQQHLAQCMEILFAPELKEKVCRELSDFTEGLWEKEYQGYMGIYRDFRSVYRILASLKEEGKLEGRGILPGLWETVKIFLKGVKKLLYGAVVAGLVGLLVYEYLRPEPIPQSPVEFSSIGTLQLRRDGGYGEENGE